MTGQDHQAVDSTAHVRSASVLFGTVESVLQPRAVWVYDWPELGPFYRVVGGPLNGSDVMAATLIAAGIAVPEKEAA